jgi:F1F0 ATPase subunit 2
MNNILLISLAGMTGIVLGIFFFGGLWITVRKSVSSNQPALWFLLSLILRVSITMLGFYYVSAGSWQKLTACLIGFTLARFLVIYRTREMDKKQVNLNQEVNHEA